MPDNWNTEDELVGQTVEIFTSFDESEIGHVVAVHRLTDTIKVRAHDDGALLIGNQWEPAEPVAALCVKLDPSELELRAKSPMRAKVEQYDVVDLALFQTELKV